ncbi:MAG: Zn-ribbon domain-containing OB-fold protein [Smithellaceae bacterium]|nr:Zn-ribbon domain-containing OB-fold protein [Smithellaceae bacterium]
MSDIFKGIEPLIYESKINVPYSWWAGDTASKFFINLRDEKKIIAPRCGSCGKVFLPPRKVCPACFTENTEWVSVSDEGTLVSYSVARRKLASIPADKKLPVVWGLVKLDGADTAILHFLDDVDPGDVKIGMRVKAVFAEQRTGGIRDISHFKPVR